MSESLTNKLPGAGVQTLCPFPYKFITDLTWNDLNAIPGPCVVVPTLNSFLQAVGHFVVMHIGLGSILRNKWQYSVSSSRHVTYWFW